MIWSRRQPLRGVVALDISRRRLLAAGLGATAAAAACGKLPWRPAKASGPPLPIVLDTPDTEQAVTAFAAFDPHVDPMLITSSRLRSLRTAKQAPSWDIWRASPGGPADSYVVLDTGFRRVNFDRSRLLPGTLQALAFDGQQYGLPISASVHCVQYQPAAFAAAGVPAPTPDWALDDFTHACAAIAAAVTAGRLPKFYGPLPPMVGRTSFPVKVGNGKAITGGSEGALADDAALATAFAVGFGGWLARGGQFDFTNTGALDGLGHLVDIARTFGGPTARLPRSQAEAGTYLNGAAMAFTTWGAQTPGPAWRYARLPAFPKAPVVTADLSGVQLVWENPNGIAYIGGVYHDPPDAAVDAITQYALWKYASAVQDPAGNGPPPIVADPAVQKAYWSAAARTATDGDIVADWRHYAFVRADWPPTNGSVADSLFQALSSVITGQADLRTALTTEQQRVNLAAQRWTQYIRDHRAAMQHAPARRS